MTNSDTELKIWAAGIFEGEGSALIENPVNKSYQIVVAVANSDQGITNPIKEVWGGHYRVDQDQYKKYSSSYRRDYSIYFSRDEAKKFLVDIFPYLRSKQSRAKVIIVVKALNSVPGEAELRARGRRRLPAGTTACLEPCYRELQELSSKRE